MNKNNNVPFIHADISQFDAHDLKRYYSQNTTKLLIGCAPCQPFSSHSTKYKPNTKDSRWGLINYFLKAVEIINPDIISMENVRGLMKQEIFKRFVSRIRKMGYQVDYDILYCPQYGIAQNRSRLVFLGCRDKSIHCPEGTHSKEHYLKVEDIYQRYPSATCWRKA